MLSSPDAQSKQSALDILLLIRQGAARTRAELMALTGLSRSTMSQRLNELFDANLIVGDGEASSTGGRPASVLRFNGSAGLVAVAAIGVSGSRVALVDLDGTVLAEHDEQGAIALGPTNTLDRVAVRIRTLLETLETSAATLWGIGVGLPGPVEFASGRPISPPIMPGWDGFPVADWLQEHFSCTALVDNDVNVMALGEHDAHYPDEDQLVFVKVGTGIGAGVIANGDLYRGAMGSAGDIGHIYVSGYDDVICECGNNGCLEAIAGGRAIARKLDMQGLQCAGSMDVVRYAVAGEKEAVLAIREAGLELGVVLAGLVNALNPGIVVLGGNLAKSGDHLLATVREVIYRRSPPLATRNLHIVASKAGDRAGVLGAAAMITKAVLMERLASHNDVAGAVSR
jgi:predicted NBD/HSP70 family sugar kinase